MRVYCPINVEETFGKVHKCDSKNVENLTLGCILNGPLLFLGVWIGLND
jgi:hypothetical protein